MLHLIVRLSRWRRHSYQSHVIADVCRSFTIHCRIYAFLDGMQDMDVTNGIYNHNAQQWNPKRAKDESQASSCGISCASLLCFKDCWIVNCCGKCPTVAERKRRQCNVSAASKRRTVGHLETRLSWNCMLPSESLCCLGSPHSGNCRRICKEQATRNCVLLLIVKMDESY
jgi:hypothetical protein